MPVHGGSVARTGSTSDRVSADCVETEHGEFNEVIDRAR
jgi:hypothetical protein